MGAWIRPAELGDTEAMLAIYTPIVEETAISFEVVPSSLKEFEGRFLKYAEGWGWLVAELEGKVVGYAYGCPFRERAAYRWSLETSAYVGRPARGLGVGKALYEALLSHLADQGFCNAYAGIALPNPASEALHRSVGFTHIGTFPAVGYKFDRWHDVAWFHRALR